MAGKFRLLADGYWVAPQITADDVKAAADMGVRLIINNRPDNEERGQPSGAEIEAAARAEGLDYRAIPIGRAPISDREIDELAGAIAAAEGPVLAYCRSGTRSTILRAFLKAREGAPVGEIMDEARRAGYDLANIRAELESLSRSRG